MAFSSRLATVRKLSTFCPGRGPKAIRYVHEAAGQRLERAIGTDVGQVSHPLLFDEIATAGEHSHEPRDDLPEQALQLIAVGGACLVKEHFIPAAVIDAVEHQAVQVDVQIGRRTKALDERDAACLGAHFVHAPPAGAESL